LHDKGVGGSLPRLMNTVTNTSATPQHANASADARRRRGRFFLGLAVACAGLTIMIQIGLNDNFLVQELGVTPAQKGILEAFRESCGIWALGLLALIAGLAEPLIGALMLMLFGVGLACYAVLPVPGAGADTFFWLVIVSLIWSQGLHIWMPLPNSMMLSLAEPGQTGQRLGQLQAAGAVGSAIGLIGAFALTFIKVPMRPMYVAAGAVCLLGALACLGVPRDIKTPGPRFVFRKAYWRYYMLSFLEGWRKQIAIAFAGYLLVFEYHTPLRVMLLLWIGVQLAGWWASPRIGRVIDRIGERPVLMFYYATLVVFFCGYAFVHNQYVLWGIFLLDNTFFALAMALTTYVRHIAPPSEHTPTLSMGVAMNHVAAVAMPLVGGYVWKYGNYKWTFAIGAAAAAASVVAASSLPVRGTRLTVEPAPPDPE
jgi:MFS family permease